MLLRTLGGLKLEGATFTRPKPLLLLAYLALEGPKERRFLADLFWLGATDPLNRLSTALARLRKAAKGAIEADDLRVWATVETDARQLLSSIEAGDDEKALSLYKGPFLEGVYLQDWGEELEEWVYGTREYLAERVRAVLLKLAEKEASQGRFDGAAKRAEAAYKLAGASVPEPEDLPRFHALMLAGGSPYAAEVRQEAEGYGVAVISSPEEAKARLLEGQEDAGAAIPTNLLTQPTPFIGREEELLEIKRLLFDEPDCRLVTLLGPGGIGKTRLASAAASRAVGAFTHGVFFVPLASLSSADHMVTAIATTLGFRFHQAGEPQEQLLAYLREKEMLLVLDNFEHLSSGAGLVTELLQDAPQLKILVTSRERLSLSAEAVLMLGGMAYPEKGIPDEMLEYDAVKLLLQRARLTRAGLDVQASDLAHAARICRLTQGMPLALVLAASWVEMLSFKEIADEISSNLDLLESEAHDMPERQRSVRAAFDYSWQRLSADEQQVFMRLSVFRGGFTRAAAQAVAGAGVRTLRRLSHKSFLSTNREGRYEVHELVRQYGEEKLQIDRVIWRQVRDGHSTYYATLLEEQSEAMKGPLQRGVFDAIAAEFENILASWYWLTEKGQLDAVILQLLPALYRYCEARARVFELLPLLDAAHQALAASENASASYKLPAILLTAQGAFYRTGYPVRFETFGIVVPANEDEIGQAWTLATTSADMRELGFWGIVLPYLYGRIIESAAGTHHLRQLLPYFRGENKRWELAFALHHLALLLQLDLRSEAEQREAAQCIAEALAIFEELGDEKESAYCLRSLGQLHHLQGSFPEAIRYWQEAQAKLQASGDWAIAADINWQLGDVYLQGGEFEEAFRCYRKMSDAYLTMGNKWIAARALSKEGYETLRYGELGLASEIQQRSLGLSREAGHTFEEAWNTWEIGEVCRVAGDLAQARHWNDQALSLFQKVQDPAGYTFYHRSLGDIALSTGDHVEAQRQFRESLKHAQATHHHWATAYTFSGLGWAALGLEQYETARQDFIEALWRVKKTETGDLGIVLAVLAGIVSLYAAIGRAERAFELGTFVIDHPLSWWETKARVSAVLQATAVLPPKRSTQEHRRAQLNNVWERADRLLEELVGSD